METTRPEKIRVLIKEPYKEPYVKEIDYTLEAMQEIVGGYIECVGFPNINGVDLYVNEEGKLDRLEGNFWLPEYEDCVVGTCFMVGYNAHNGQNKDITDKQIEHCKEYIKYFDLGKYDLYYDFDLLQMLMKNRKKMYDENKKLQKNQGKTAEM